MAKRKSSSFRTNFLSLLAAVIFMFSGSYQSLKAQSQTVSINNKLERLSLTSEYYKYFVDSTHQPINKVLNGEDEKMFHAFPNKLPWLLELDQWYWVELNLALEEKMTETLVLEFIDFKIGELELYTPDPNVKGRFNVHKTGSTKPFSQRPFLHKNFTFKLPLTESGNYKVYARVKASEKVNLMIVVSKVETFVQYASTEYFMLSLFFGMVLITCISTFFIFFSIKEKSYLFYGLYVAFVGIYFLCRVGLGFEFIWPNAPELNMYLRPLSLFGFSIFYLLYASAFLNINLKVPTRPKWNGYIAPALLVLLIVAETVINNYEEGFLLAWIPFAYILMRSIRGLKNKEIKNYLVLIGSGFVFIGLICDNLQKYSIIPNDWLGYYAVMIGFTLEMLTLTWAMAVRIRDHVKEKNSLQMRINAELEIKVAQRTRQLEEKNEEMDMFAYRFSNDIKGPLKSIIGACNMANLEQDPDRTMEYVQSIEKVAKKLDQMIMEMSRISSLEQQEEKPEEINIRKVVSQIIVRNTKGEKWENVTIENLLDDRDIIVAYPILFYVSIQNLFDNAIKCRDASKPGYTLRVYSKRENGGHQIILEDNGLGMSGTNLLEVFSSIERSNNNGPDTNLGMLGVKKSMDKLGMNMDVYSLKNEGTRIVISAIQE